MLCENRGTEIMFQVRDRTRNKTWGWQQQLHHMSCYTATLKYKTGAKELAEGHRTKSEKGLATSSAAGAAACCWWPLSATAAADSSGRMTARANAWLSFQMNDIWLGHCGKIYAYKNLWKICKEPILCKSI